MWSLNSKHAYFISYLASLKTHNVDKNLDIIITSRNSCGKKIAICCDKKIATLIKCQKNSILTYARVKKKGSAAAGLLKAVSAACKNPLPNL